jgi:hypothetical protein
MISKHIFSQTFSSKNTTSITIIKHAQPCPAFHYPALPQWLVHVVPLWPVALGHALWQ